MAVFDTEGRRAACPCLTEVVASRKGPALAGRFFSLAFGEARSALGLAANGRMRGRLDLGRPVSYQLRLWPYRAE